VATTKSSTRRDASARVLQSLTEMIVNGELLPGQQVHQERISQQLNVSRLPLREAMKQLTAAGLLKHTYNAGYTVTRLDSSEFDQIYLLRSILEAEVLRRISAPTDEAAAQIEDVCAQVERAADAVDLESMRALNREFHFLIFNLSGLNILVDELHRVWTLIAPYHAIYYSDETARNRVLAEHRQMLEAARRGDGERLAELMSAHRQGGEGNLNDLLKRGS